MFGGAWGGEGIARSLQNTQEVRPVEAARRLYIFIENTTPSSCLDRYLLRRRPIMMSRSTPSKARKSVPPELGLCRFVPGPPVFPGAVRLSDVEPRLYVLIRARAVKSCVIQQAYRAGGVMIRDLISSLDLLLICVTFVIPQLNPPLTYVVKQHTITKENLRALWPRTLKYFINVLGSSNWLVLPVPGARRSRHPPRAPPSITVFNPCLVHVISIDLVKGRHLDTQPWNDGILIPRQNIKWQRSPDIR